VLSLVGRRDGGDDDAMAMVSLVYWNDENRADENRADVAFTTQTRANIYVTSSGCRCRHRARAFASL